MLLSSLDWIIVTSVLTATLIIVFRFTRKSSENSKEFFLSGKNTDI